MKTFNRVQYEQMARDIFCAMPDRDIEEGCSLLTALPPINTIRRWYVDIWVPSATDEHLKRFVDNRTTGAAQ